MILSFSEYLQSVGFSVDPELDIADGTLTQSQFSTHYTNWLTSIFGDADVQKWLLTNYGISYESFSVSLNQNDEAALPTISYVDETGQTVTLGNEVLDALFGAKESTLVLTGKTTQLRWYADEFETSALQEMFGPQLTIAQPDPISDTSATDDFAALSGALTATDPEASDVLLYSIADGAFDSGKWTRSTDFGVLTVTEATGEWSFEPNDAAINALGAGAVDSVGFEIQVTDQHGFIDTETLWIDLTGANDDPVAVADANAGDAVTEEGHGVAGDPSAAGNVLANDTDADDGDTKVVVGVQAGSLAGPVAAGVGAAVAGTYGTLTLASDGNWTYALDNPNPDTNALAQDAAASDVFTYTMTDSHGVSSTTTLIIDITGTNDAPETAVGSENTTGTEDVPVTGTLLPGSDVDGDTLTFVQAATSPVGGSVAIDPNTGDYIFTPTDDFNGPASFTYVVSDGTVNSAEKVVNIEIAPVNDAPVASAVNLGSVAEESSFTITEADLLAGVQDVDGPAASITSLSIQSGKGALHDNGGGSWTYTGAPNDDTGVTFAYAASDGEHTASSTASLDITPVNDNPTVAVSGGVPGTKEDTPSMTTSVVRLSKSDVDGDPITYDTGGWVQISSTQFHKNGYYGSAVLNTSENTLTYTLDNGRNQTNALNTGHTVYDQFSVSVKDPSGASASVPVAFSVQGATDYNVMDFEGISSSTTIVSSYAEDGLVAQGLTTSSWGGGHLHVAHDYYTGDTSVYVYPEYESIRIQRGGAAFDLKGLDVEYSKGTVTFVDSNGRTSTLSGGVYDNLSFGSYFDDVVWVDIKLSGADPYVRIDDVLWA